MSRLEAYAVDTQRGGLQKRGTDFASHSVREFLSAAAVA